MGNDENDEHEDTNVENDDIYIYDEHYEMMKMMNKY
jgi:hypothetical protein